MAKKKARQATSQKRMPLVPNGTRKRLTGQGLKSYQKILITSNRVKVTDEAVKENASKKSNAAKAKGTFKHPSLTQTLVEKTIEVNAPPVNEGDMKNAGGRTKAQVGMEKLANAMGFETLELAGNDDVRLKKIAILKALVITMNNVSQMSILTGISRQLYQVYERTDPVFAQAVLDMKHIALDFVEGKMMQAIGEGNVTAIIYYLRTQGRDRGWDDRTNLFGRSNYVPDPLGDGMQQQAPQLRNSAGNTVTELQGEVPASSLDSIIKAITQVHAEKKNKTYEAEVVG
jgi:hypothetical protein